MAITISGENNNDRILAQDGVIDEISGINIVGLLTAGHINVGDNIQLGNAGVATATTFIGNLTGNVNASSNLLLQIGGTEKVRLNSSGNLGIGNNNPGDKLVVNGAITSLANNVTTYAARLRAIYDSTHALTLESYHNSSTPFEVIGTHADSGGSNPRVVIAKGGQKVGINTAAVINDFTLLTDGNGYIDFNGSGGKGAEMNVYKKDDKSLTYKFANNGGQNELAQHYLTNAAGKYLWYIGGTAASNEKMRLHNNGHLGIGTATPNSALPLTIAGQYPGIQFKDTNGTTSFNINADDGLFRIQTGVAGAGPSPRLNINSDGDVLINTITTPTADIKLLVNGNGGVSSGSYFSFRGEYANIPEPAAYAIKYDSSATHLSGAGGLHQYAYGGVAFSLGGQDRVNFTTVGKVLIGSTTHNTLIASGVGSQLQVEGNSYQTSSVALINNSTSTDPPFLNFGKSRAGTAGGTTIVQNGDRVGGIRWSVADGTDLHSRVAQIDVFVDGTPGSNDTPGQISIQTTPDGSNTPVDRVNIDSAGRVTLGAGTQSQFASQFNGGANQLLITSNGDTGLTIDSTSSSSSSIHFADGPTGNESYRGIIEYKHSEDDMKFAVAGQHVARLRKGSYSDVGGGMIIGNHADVVDSAHSDSRTLILGATTHGETGMTLLNSTTGTGKIRFSDGVQYYNQGAIGYYHGTRTVAQIPNYGESLSFVAAQKENNFVLNGNEAIRVCSDMDRQKMVDGFWSKAINTTFQTVFTIRSGYDNSSVHRAYFYEIIVFGGDWGSHSANRTYFKGFINGANTYQGHTVIEHSGTYGSNTGGQGHYGSSECQIQVTFTGNGHSHIQMRLTTGSYRAEGYARFIGFIRDYDGFHIR